MKKIIWLIGLVFVFIIMAAFLYPVKTKQAKQEMVIVDTLVKGLTVPWDICFLPTGEMLFTERPGRVRLYRNNQLEEKSVLHIPDIEAEGKMGLLGLCLHPDFTVNHFIYLAYNYKTGNQTFLRVVRYEYRNEELIHPKTIIENIPGVFNHTGCRLKFGPDRKLYITTGDADVPKLAQDLKAYNGKILRLNEDGTIPADNPFIRNDTAKHEVWSYGHRNPQGIAFQPGTGKLYSSEHGPTGGDEINLIVKGNNYGWPVIHHRDRNDAMMSPLMEFSPSIGPAEALFYSGRAFAAMKGNLLVGCMRGEAILNVQFNQNKIASYDFLLKNKYGRIRAMAEGADGYLYFSTSQVDPPESRLQAGERGFDMILRLRPATSAKAGKGFAIQTSTGLKEAINANNVAVTMINRSVRRSATLYSQLCASCHGANMEGKEKVPSLVDGTWINGGTRMAIKKSVSNGIVSKGMPAWEGVLTPAEINQMADYILQHKK